MEDYNVLLEFLSKEIAHYRDLIARGNPVNEVVEQNVREFLKLIEQKIFIEGLKNDPITKT